MKILLLGEYSNVHWTLAEGLRSLGHKVCVVSNGDFWKNYKRDISLVRKQYTSYGGIKYLFKLLKLLPQFRNYDVVQIINPMFLELKAEHIKPIYKFLKRHNKKIFMGAFGMDAYWVDYCTRQPYPFRYSDFNIGNTPIDTPMNREFIATWKGTAKEHLNRYIANDCNGIIAGLYEYYTAYKEDFANKLVYIPFPINIDKKEQQLYTPTRKIRIFIGIQSSRSIYKGTDIMLRALERIEKEYPDDCEVIKAENIPFEEYSQMLNSCDIQIDQLYGYSPAMNALLALSKGKIVVGGGEEECYNILGEKELHPIINVEPDENDIYNKLKELILKKENISRVQQESILFIERHHTPQKTASKYIEFWNSK